MLTDCLAVRAENPTCIGTFNLGEMSKSSSDSEFYVAEVAVCPVVVSGPLSEQQHDETEVETFTVAPNSLGSKLDEVSMYWSSGQALRLAPGPCSSSFSGIGDPLLPPLMTK